MGVVFTINRACNVLYTSVVTMKLSTPDAFSSECVDLYLVDCVGRVMLSFMRTHSITLLQFLWLTTTLVYLYILKCNM